MELIQIAGPAIQDLGIYDLQAWSGSFDDLYRKIFDSLFDKNRKTHDHIVPILEELERQSFCGKDKELLGRALARVGGTLAFQEISMDRKT